MRIEDQITQRIIREQELIMGPVAWDEARKVRGLRVDEHLRDAHVEGEPKSVLEALIARYERLFGLASRRVSRDAALPLISKLPKDQLPKVLR